MDNLNDNKIKFLEQKANDIRISIIDILEDAGSGHTAGPLDMADIFTVLFFHTLKHNPKEPAWPERDRLVLSNGHICPVLYSTMAHAGYFPIKELKTLSMALADKIDHGLTSNRRIYALLSDGELECGQTWEAAMLAGKEKLHNLVAVVDRNNIQIDGYTEDVMPLESLSDKWRAWNWHVIEIDGHNMEEIADAFETAKAIFGKPTVIIAHTIAGKGVKEFERDYRWHGKPPNKEEKRMAINELRTLGGKIKSEHE